MARGAQARDRLLIWGESLHARNLHALPRRSIQTRCSIPVSADSSAPLIIDYMPLHLRLENNARKSVFDHSTILAHRQLVLIPYPTLDECDIRRTLFSVVVIRRVACCPWDWVVVGLLHVSGCSDPWLVWLYFPSAALIDFRSHLFILPIPFTISPPPLRSHIQYFWASLLLTVRINNWFYFLNKQLQAIVKCSGFSIPIHWYNGS